MQNNKEHIWNAQRIPLVVAVSNVSLTGALSHWQSAAFAGIGKSAFLLHLYLPHFIK